MGIKCPKCQFENPDVSHFCINCGALLHPGDEKISSFTAKTLKLPTEGLKTGSIFADRYQIIEKLGEGGMGKVYKVHDKEIDAKVVLKLLLPEIAADSDTIERFRNEIRLAREISHKNVCRMFDLNKEESTYYITMEYVPGENLKNVIQMTKRLSLGTALNIAKQICLGLSEAHRLGIVHRDLKPSNIMIDKAGDAKIMDFGLARSISSRGITGTGFIIGTPQYMSPEQVQGEGIDQRSDIYSLGVILYEMLTGRLPFEGDSPVRVALKHTKESPPDPRKINAEIPEEISRVILKCLEKGKEKSNLTVN